MIFEVSQNYVLINVVTYSQTHLFVDGRYLYCGWCFLIINLYMIEQPPKQQIKIHKLPQLGAISSVVWVQNSQKLPFAQQETRDQHDDYLKKEHQAYLVQKLKRKEELIKNKRKQFGDSSSDSDNQINIQKKATKDSSNELKVKKTVQYQSGKASSKADSQNSVTLKKIQSVHVGSSKAAQNIEVLDIFINSKKGMDIWIQQNLKFKEKIIQLGDFQCSYYQMNKIKVIFTETSDQAFKIKINWSNQQFIFAASKIKIQNQLPQVFYIFGKIITEKLSIMNKNKFYEEKIFQFPQSMIKKSLMYGKILKKSRLINKWSSVYASINNEGLWYSKKYTDKQKLLIKRLQVTEIWTRFEFEEGHLIIKLFQNSKKIEIGIPVGNFMQRNNWLFLLYDLAFQRP